MRPRGSNDLRERAALEGATLEDRNLFSIGVHRRVESALSAWRRLLSLQAATKISFVDRTELPFNCCLRRGNGLADKCWAVPPRSMAEANSVSMPASSCPGSDVRALRAIVRSSENDPCGMTGPGASGPRHWSTPPAFRFNESRERIDDTLSVSQIRRL